MRRLRILFLAAAMALALLAQSIAASADPNDPGAFTSSSDSYSGTTTSFEPDD